jgi:hypothetical protein
MPFDTAWWFCHRVVSVPIFLSKEVSGYVVVPPRFIPAKVPTTTDGNPREAIRYLVQPWFNGTNGTHYNVS